MDQTVSDEELMDRLAGGDASAMEELMERYERSVLNTVYRFLGDAQRAEELAQEVFLTVYQQRRRYRPRAKFSTWLFRIVRNRCLNELRDRQKLFRHTAQPGEAIEHLADTKSVRPDQRIMQAELETTLNAALQSLPESQRLAFVLSQIQGFTYKQVAETLGVSVSACESLIHRARLALRDKLRPLRKASSK